MKVPYLVPLFCLFLLCTQEARVDSNLFGTWLVIGTQSRTPDRIVDGIGYSVDEAFTVYRIEENSITKFIRGYNLISDRIEYFDSLQKVFYTASFDGNTITLNDSMPLLYDVRSRCNAQFLKLTEQQTGHDFYYNKSVTVDLNEYCIRINNDSLPSTWPGEDDVTLPDENCDPGDLLDW